MECRSAWSANTLERGLSAGVSALDSTTALAKLSDAITQLEAELASSHKLAVLGMIAAVVAHEMNNVMTPVLARAELALSTGDPADMRKALERARLQMQLGIAITKRLQDASRHEDNPLEACSVASAVQEAIQIATRPFEKDGIELELSIPSELRVRAHRDLLEQVLLNLLVNARESMKGLHGKLAVRAAREGDSVVIDVRDSGRGLPPQVLAGASNPLPAGRSGACAWVWPIADMALNACRTISGRQGATMEALANPDRGCTFRLRWPAA